jgi:hypothetical protein
MYKLCMKYMETKVYEMYNKNRIFLQYWLMVYWYAITHTTSCANHRLRFYYTPNGQIQVTVYDLQLTVTIKN